MKVFLIFILLAGLNVGLVILLDLIQPIPFHLILDVLTLPFRLIRGQELILLVCYMLLLVISHRNIVKNSKKTG